MKRGKLKKFAVLLIFPLHLMLYYTFVHGTHEEAFYYGELLFVLLADFVLSFWQMEIFTSRRNSIRIFAGAFLPYLLQNVMLLAANVILLLLLCRDGAGILSNSFGYSIAGSTR